MTCLDLGHILGRAALVGGEIWTGGGLFLRVKGTRALPDLTPSVDRLLASIAIAQPGHFTMPSIMRQSGRK